MYMRCRHDTEGDESQDECQSRFATGEALTAPNHRRNKRADCLHGKWWGITPPIGLARGLGARPSQGASAESKQSMCQDTLGSVAFVTEASEREVGDTLDVIGRGAFDCRVRTGYEPVRRSFRRFFHMVCFAVDRRGSGR